MDFLSWNEAVMHLAIDPQPQVLLNSLKLYLSLASLNYKFPCTCLCIPMVLKTRVIRAVRTCAPKQRGAWTMPAVPRILSGSYFFFVRIPKHSKGWGVVPPKSLHSCCLGSPPVLMVRRLTGLGSRTW